MALRLQAFAAVLLVTLLTALIAASYAGAITYSYFPSASSTDGRMLTVAGNNLQTLGGNTVTLSFSVSNVATSFALGFFDGADMSVWDWDQTTPITTNYQLYADPLGDGSGTTLVASWTDADMTQNSWRDFGVLTSAAARSPSGTYFYRLTVSTITTNNTLNNFKVRVEGRTFITPTSVFGFMGARASGITTSGAYDGTWDFYLIVPNAPSYFALWDGDLDYGPSAFNGDTDDPNTSNTGIPPWSPPSAQPEGAKGQGQPPDDNTNVTLIRSPDICYDVITPDGQTFQDLNPSGNSEWECFRIDTAPFDASQMDHHAGPLPAGIYHVRVRGADWRNTCAMRFDYPLAGQDENGNPILPPSPFVVGNRVWNDVVPDGVKEPSESGIAGVTLTARDALSGAVVGTATTDASGLYTISLWNGTYHVSVDPANFQSGGPLFGYQPTTSETLTVTVEDGDVMSANFGERAIPEVDVFPERAASCAPSDTVAYYFTVKNNTGAAGTFDLGALSTLGFANQILDASLMPITSVTLASDESTTVVVRVNVPLSAVMGSQDVTQLTATLRTDGAVSGSATALTTVMSAIDVSPDNAGSTGRGTTIDYAHTVVNSSSSTRTVTLSATDSRGWTVGIYAADGVTPVGSLSLGPNGGSAGIVVRVTVPAGAAVGTVDTTVFTAQTGAASDTATDTTTVQNLVTYPTASYSAPSDDFVLGDTVYARVTGLTAGRTYYFVWRDPSGATVRTSPSFTGVTTRTDSYGLLGTDAVGTWTVLVYRSTGALFATHTFRVSYAAEISLLYASDARTVPGTTTITSSEYNAGSATISSSSVDYRIWWDSDGDGTFDSGDACIRSDGTAATYSGSGSAITHTTSGITVESYQTFDDPGWEMSNRDFPYQGEYKVTATWRDSGGRVLDEKTTSFFSVPALGALTVLLAGFLLAPLAWMLRRRRRWLASYALSAFGFSLLAVLFLREAGTDTLIAGWENAQAAWLAGVFGIPVRVAAGSLILPNAAGWTLMRIGIECSAIIEMAVLVGLVAFYPGFPRRQRIALVTIGIAATYAVNLVRLLIILAIADRYGPSSLFVAHAIVGRAFFFIAVVALYWWLLTRTTLRRLARELRPA